MSATVSQFPHKEAVREAIRKLALACGLSQPISESDTETFVYRLRDAIGEVEQDIQDSHDEGLCLDAFSALAGYMVRA